MLPKRAEALLSCEASFGDSLGHSRDFGARNEESQKTGGVWTPTVFRRRCWDIVNFVMAFSAGVAIVWIFSSLLLLGGGYIIFMNAGIFWWTVVLQRKGPSIGPFLGGMLMAAGLWVSPIHLLHRCWWIAFFIDAGCVPIILVAVIAHFRDWFVSRR
jgi:hypothetical protein